jgi:hypothetical protein
MINIDTCIDIILLIHRGLDGYIGFTRTPSQPKIGRDGKPTNFESLFSIRVDELRSILPGFKAYLFADSFMTVNSAYRGAWWQGKAKELPGVLRKEKYLRYLNACYADLDIGRPESKIQAQRLTFPEASYRIQVLTELEEIPAPSFVVRSGRGAYLLWLLRDEEKPEMPERARVGNITLYKRINKAIGAKLEPLAWDRIAHDAARVLRVPGSYHTKAKKYVGYQVQYDLNGKLFLYSLNELAAFMGLKIPEKPIELYNKIIDITETPNKFRKTKNPGSTPNRKRGQITLIARRLEDLYKLEEYSGGFNYGVRRRRLTFLGECMARLEFPKHETFKALEKMAGNCNPPYPHESNDPPLKTILNTVYSGKRGSIRAFKNETLCKELGITAELARELELKTIVPEEITQERKSKPTQRKIDHEQRQAVYYEILQNHFHASCREISNVLKERGIKGNHVTVSKELPEVRRQIQVQRLTLLKAS